MTVRMHYWPSDMCCGKSNAGRVDPQSIYAHTVLRKSASRQIVRFVLPPSIRYTPRNAGSPTLRTTVRRVVVEHDQLIWIICGEVSKGEAEGSAKHAAHAMALVSAPRALVAHHTFLPRVTVDKLTHSHAMPLATAKLARVATTVPVVAGTEAVLEALRKATGSPPSVPKIATRARMERSGRAWRPWFGTLRDTFTRAACAVAS